MQNISHENDLIFMRMNQQVTWNWPIHPRAGIGILGFHVTSSFSKTKKISILVKF